LLIYTFRKIVPIIKIPFFGADYKGIMLAHIAPVGFLKKPQKNKGSKKATLKTFL
jgi:hypothetical protein